MSPIQGVGISLQSPKCLRIQYLKEHLAIFTGLAIGMGKPAPGHPVRHGPWDGGPELGLFCGSAPVLRFPLRVRAFNTKDIELNRTIAIACRTNLSAILILRP